jgi:hypothetical protein
LFAGYKKIRQDGDWRSQEYVQQVRGRLAGILPLQEGRGETDEQGSGQGWPLPTRVVEGARRHAAITR